MDSFYQYSKDLAVNMFIRKVTSLQVKSSGYKVLGIVENEKKNIWSRFFDDTQIMTKLARRGAQIIEDDGVIRFTHKSIMEYFAAKQFYDEIVDYNPDSLDDFEPCLNKGPVIDHETAVYQFIRYINDSQMKKDEPLTVLDKKLLEVLSSTAVQKIYRDDLEENFLFPNIFLMLLLSKNIKAKISELPEDSPVTAVLVGLLKWLFSPPQESLRGPQRFLEMLNKVDTVSFESIYILEEILPLYYHSITKQSSGVHFDDRLTTEKRKLRIKVCLNADSYGGGFTVKNDTIVEDSSNNIFSWVLDAKLFIHKSQDSIAVFKTEAGDKCISLDATKRTSKSQQNLTDFTLSDANTAWNVRESKWIMRMNQYERAHFELVSMANSTKRLYGHFSSIKDYKTVFADICSADIHIGSTTDESYTCITCGLDKDGTILCKSCIEICHKGHEIAEYGQSNGYCDCRFMGACKVALGCSERFAGQRTDHVMFKCTQCPNAKRNTILCNGCMLHHQQESEHHDFEKVKESMDDCQCNCVSNKTRVIGMIQAPADYDAGHYEEDHFKDSDSEEEDDN